MCCRCVRVSSSSQWGSHTQPLQGHLCKHTSTTKSSPWLTQVWCSGVHRFFATRSFASWRPVHLMISVSFRQTLWELNQIWHECNFTGCAFVSTLLHLLWVQVPGTACHHCSGGDADANSRYFWKVISDVSSHQSMTVITGVSLYLYPLPLFAVTHKHDTFIDKDESVI